mmetsp:Transcript_51227/g.163792  ORF Transcript_51227/g.163792 Transcript_51227/m.163792 type:complete len:204 (+) Transcript_51227:210-821(+)
MHRVPRDYARVPVDGGVRAARRRAGGGRGHRIHLQGEGRRRVVVVRGRRRDGWGLRRPLPRQHEPFLHGGQLGVRGRLLARLSLQPHLDLPHLPQARLHDPAQRVLSGRPLLGFLLQRAELPGKELGALPHGLQLHGLLRARARRTLGGFQRCGQLRPQRLAIPLGTREGLPEVVPRRLCCRAGPIHHLQLALRSSLPLPERG